MAGFDTMLLLKLLSGVTADGARERAAHLIATLPAPPSFGSDKLLLAINLWVMLTGTYLSAHVWLSEAAAIIRCRAYDRWNHPVTAVRVTMVFVGLAAFLRCGAEAASIMGWDPRDPTTGAVVLSLKRYIDPVAVGLLFMWVAMRQVSKRSVDQQLRRDPLPASLWATLPQLAKPLVVAVLVSGMAFGFVYLRGV